MARERMVTRTIVFQETEVMCLDISSAKAHIGTFCTASPSPLSIDQLKERYDTGTIKLVSIVSNRTKEQVYGMREDDFMKHAHVINR